MPGETARTVRAVIAPRDALEFLTRAGAVLADSLNYEQTLAHVVELVVPEIADWCGVYIADGDGREREITSRHADPELERIIVGIRRRRREDSDSSESLRVLATGRSILATDVVAAPTDIAPEERAGVDRLGARSYMIVPLRARSRVIGALTLLSTREGRHYREADPGRGDRRPDAARDGGGPPLPRGGPLVRRDARRALRAGDRQRAPVPGGRALPRPARHAVRHRAGRPRVPRRRRLLRPGEPGARSAERRLRGGPPRGPRRRAARPGGARPRRAPRGGDGVGRAPTRARGQRRAARRGRAARDRVVHAGARARRPGHRRRRHRHRHHRA